MARGSRESRWRKATRASAAGTFGAVLGAIIVLSLLVPAVPAHASSTGSGTTRTVPGLVDPEFAPQILSSPTGTGFGNFGTSLAMSGTSLAIGDPYQSASCFGGVYTCYGAVYLENTATGSALPLVDRLLAVGSALGDSVAIGGGKVVAGAPGADGDGGAVVVFNATNGAQLTTLTSPNANPGLTGGLFGDSVAVSGNLVVVGAPFENVSTTYQAGHVYVFNLATNSTTMLSSPSPQISGEFGYSVAISGSTIVVGAPGETTLGTAIVSGGNAYLFAASTGDLITNLSSQSPNAFGQFGRAVALSGTTAVVGAPGENYNGHFSAGTAYWFSLLNGLRSRLVSPNAADGGRFGTSLAIDPSTIVVGAPGESPTGSYYAGSAYLFSTLASTFISSQFAPPDWPANGAFGIAVAQNATAVAVGAPYENASGVFEAGHAYLFSHVPLRIAISSDTARDFFGSAVGVNSGNVVVGDYNQSVGAFSQAGAAYFFHSNGSLQLLVSPNAQTGGEFGDAVAVSSSAIVVGAPGETDGAAASGAAYIFSTSSGTLIATLASPNPNIGGNFGACVAVNGPFVVVGAPTETVGAVVEEGRAYVFSSTTGALLATLTSLNPTAYGAFGYSVGVSGGWAVVGAPDEASFYGDAYRFNASTGGSAYQLVSAVPQAGAYYGYSIAIGGGTVVVGSPDQTHDGDIYAGAVVTFSTTTWATTGSYFSPNPVSYGGFGWSVATNGGTVVVGAPGESAFGIVGAGSIYLVNPASHTTTDRYNDITPQTDEDFGEQVAIGAGGVIVAGANPPGGSPGSAFEFFL